MSEAKDLRFIGREFHKWEILNIFKRDGMKSVIYKHEGCRV